MMFPYGQPCRREAEIDRLRFIPRPGRGENEGRDRSPIGSVRGSPFQDLRNAGMPFLAIFVGLGVPRFAAAQVQFREDDPQHEHGRKGVALRIGRKIVHDLMFKVEPLEVIDAGEDQVVAVLRISGRAKLSGVETDLTFAVVNTIRDGKIARGREYWTKEQALEAAGLRE